MLLTRMVEFNIIHFSMWILVATSRAYGTGLMEIENILLSSMDLTFVLTWRPVLPRKNDSESAVIYNVVARITYGIHANTHYFNETSLPTLEFKPPQGDKMYMHTWKFMIKAMMDGQLIAKGKSRTYYGLDSAVKPNSLSPPLANLKSECDFVTVTLETPNEEMSRYDWFFQIRFVDGASPSEWMTEIEPSNNMAQINLTIPRAVANVCIEARYQMLFGTASKIMKVCAVRQCSSTTAYPEIINTKTVLEVGYADYDLIIISSVAFVVTVFLSFCLIKTYLRNYLKNESKELPETMKRVIDITLETGIYNEGGKQEESVLEMELLEENPSKIIHDEDEPLLLPCAKSEVSPKKQITNDSESHSSEAVDEVVARQNCSNDASSSTNTSETIVITDILDNNNRNSLEPSNYSQINLIQDPEIQGNESIKEESVNFVNITVARSVEGGYILKTVK